MEWFISHSSAFEYRLNFANEPERGFRDDQPLTTVTKLDSYVAKATGLKGRMRSIRETAGKATER